MSGALDDSWLDAPIVLAEILDMRAAGPLAAELLARRGRRLSIDGSAVGRIGGQCLQVLLAAQTCWADAECGFGVISPSADLLDGLAVLGCPGLVQACGG